jgi:hypothetical protein
MKTYRLIIIGLLILVALGRIMPMTLFPEQEDPWYLRYTTLWWIAAGFIFYPSALVSEAIGLTFTDNTFLIVDAIWLILLCLAIYFIRIPATESEDEN